MSQYGKAAEFERRVCRDMEGRGYIAVRAAGSRTPADVYCMGVGRLVFVQCKTNGYMTPSEWNTLYDYAGSVGATPVIASKDDRGHIRYMLMTGHKVPHERQPMVEWAPERGDRHEVQGVGAERD